MPKRKDRKGKKKEIENVVTRGKRKSSIARATISKGGGKVTINKRPHTLLPELRKLTIEEPLRIAKDVLGGLDYDIKVNVKGGGQESRIEASRLAIARALVEITGNKELEEEFTEYDRSLLVADTRSTEP